MAGSPPVSTLTNGNSNLFFARIQPNGRGPEGVVTFSRGVSATARVSLDEELVDTAAWDGNAVRVTVGPKKIVCLKVTVG